ncbi:MAG: hypothetical protein GX222_04860 [Ruminococcaceae bacterium]|nr:hypothetical protein [Oscillospiraceae bacterium]
MKKILAILLVIAIVFALSACGNLKKIKSAISDIADGQVLDGDGMIKEDSGGKPRSKSKGYTISNEVLYDDDDLTITVTEVGESDYGDVLVKLLVENKSDDNMILYSEETIYNGYMIKSYWYAEVAAGKKSNTEMTFYEDDLLMAGVGSADEIVFKLVGYSDDYEEDYLDDYFVIYPTGLDAGSVIYPERAPVKGETVLVDNDALTVIIESADPDGLWGYTLQIYVENKTGVDMYISTDDESVNGFMTDIYWGETVLSGAKSVSKMTIYDDDLEANGIDKIEEIELYLEAYNLDDWNDVIFEDTIIYNP